jgi:acetyl-CoA carboxylase alpha subunit
MLEGVRQMAQNISHLHGDLDGIEDSALTAGSAKLAESIKTLEVVA